eukprot:CAMPEP_0176387374 /NCGR_PEP_ID=MMETSP0126-20121128/36714_1 /TAXON_ID=141414 ORGANISM="Strombidinopsis acuminatum, Strain SPMC142" /NCGR_SAMPLE_ID=MMETSP0126 /ASSEMBLY_ACC=CAM_ASM_000229 /LENGTH=85 /DNA_ID=CAMNT_0017754927 /DNA_START=32 /DNA_END=286 /DNA_ORIENTATION=-
MQEESQMIPIAPQKENENVQEEEKEDAGAADDVAMTMEKVSRITNSTKAGTKFPVGRIAKFCKQGRYSDRIGAGAPVYMAAVLEY